MNITKRFMTKNRCYTNEVKINVEKLVLHSLGCAQPNAQVPINSWDSYEAGVSVHAFIQENTIIQTLPWNYKAWHVGKGSKGSWNGCSIGVEICEPAGHKYNGGTMVNYDVKKNSEYFAKVYTNAVELFAYLCREFKLDPLEDILCHCEVHKLGYGSNHADVMQWFPKHGKSMDTFRSDVKAQMERNIIPSKTITRDSSEDDIRWAKIRLNDVLPDWFPKLDDTGVYDSMTRIAVLTYWNQLGWAKDMVNDGTKIGKATREALAAGKTA